MKLYMMAAMAALTLAATPALGQVGVLSALGDAEPTAESSGYVTVIRAAPAERRGPMPSPQGAQVFRQLDHRVVRTVPEPTTEQQATHQALRPIGAHPRIDISHAAPHPIFVRPQHRVTYHYFIESGTHSRYLELGIHKLHLGHLHGRYVGPGYYASEGFRRHVYEPGPGIHWHNRHPRSHRSR